MLAPCAQVPPAVPLSSMNTDAVCDLIKHIDGMDAAMLPQYGATVKKVRQPFQPPPHT